MVWMPEDHGPYSGNPTADVLSIHDSAGDSIEENGRQRYIPKEIR